MKLSKSVTTVTPFSIFLATVILLILFLAAFRLGLRIDEALTCGK